MIIFFIAMKLLLLSTVLASPKVVNYVIQGVPTEPIGGTHIILSFLEPSTPAIPADNDPAWIKYAVAEWSNTSNRAAILEKLHNGNTLLLASLGGAAASHSIYSKYDPVAFGRRAAKYVVDLGLDGLDVDLEGWGNDPSGANFLKNVTRGAFDYFKKVSHDKKFAITHAPEMPDFWHRTLYTKVMADRATFDMIDFCNVQFYNQLMFPDLDHIYIQDMYDPTIGAPTCMKHIAQDIADTSNGTISFEEANDKLLLGFPYKDGSFPVGKENLNQGGQLQFDAVKYGVSTLKYPLAGVFEWTAASVTFDDLRSWNKNMTQVLH